MSLEDFRRMLERDTNKREHNAANLTDITSNNIEVDMPPQDGASGRIHVIIDQGEGQGFEPTCTRSTKWIGGASTNPSTDWFNADENIQ